MALKLALLVTLLALACAGPSRSDQDMISYYRGLMQAMDLETPEFTACVQDMLQNWDHYVQVWGGDPLEEPAQALAAAYVAAQPHDVNAAIAASKKLNVAIPTLIEGWKQCGVIETLNRFVKIGVAIEKHGRGEIKDGHIYNNGVQVDNLIFDTAGVIGKGAYETAGRTFGSMMMAVYNAGPKVAQNGPSQSDQDMISYYRGLMQAMDLETPEFTACVQDMLQNWDHYVQVWGGNPLEELTQALAAAVVAAQPRNVDAAIWAAKRLGEKPIATLIEGWKQCGVTDTVKRFAEIGVAIQKHGHGEIKDGHVYNNGVQVDTLVFDITDKISKGDYEAAGNGFGSMMMAVYNAGPKTFMPTRELMEFNVKAGFML